MVASQFAGVGLLGKKERKKFSKGGGEGGCWVVEVSPTSSTTRREDRNGCGSTAVEAKTEKRISWCLGIGVCRSLSLAGMEVSSWGCSKVEGR